MAAAAFVATLIFQSMSTGETFSYYCTVSDVNAEFYIFPDGNNFVTMPSNKGNIVLTDVQLSAAGTDTRTAEIFVNGKTSGERILNAANLSTNLARQFRSAPFGIAGGANLRLTQRT